MEGTRKEEAVTPMLADRLMSLPRLDPVNARTAVVQCKICGQGAPFFDVVDFNKCAAYYPFGPSGVTLSYHRCDACGFLFTPFFDDWTHDDFRRFVYNEDYTIVDPDYVDRRPTQMAEQMARLLNGYQDARILDYGAGRGVFAERMAVLGFPHVESYDPFSMPTRPKGKFEVITCTEVIEHTPSPLQAFADMRAFMTDQSCIILSETLQPSDICRVRGNWWYVAPRNGHVSTFADRTLSTVAAKLGLMFHRGTGHHLLQTVEVGRFTDLAAHIGPAVTSVRLYAPAEGRVDDFHGIEGQQGARFRWTATDTVLWSAVIPLGPSHLVQLSVPYAHESRQGFAAACTLDVGGRTGAVSIRESAIFAEIPAVASGPIVVTLRTPELLQPPRDARKLGLAIAMADVA
jgi:hypothetical protein